MIRALLRKEIRLQLPFLVLVLLLIAIDWADILVEQSPELGSAESQMDAIVDDEGDNAVPFFLLVFSFSIGLLVRELDERTQEFMDALPVSRSLVFATKVCLAIAVLGVLVLSEVFAAAWTFRVSASSLRPEIPWPWILDGALFTAAQLLLFLSLGLLLSFARPYAWFCFGLLFWIQRLAETFESRAKLVNPFSLASGFLRTTPVAWPITHWSVLVSLSTAALAASYFAFARSEGGASTPPAESPKRGLKRWRSYVLGPATFVLLVTTFGYLLGRDEDPAEGTLTKPRRVVAHARTDHYVITYPGTLADRARSLVVAADVVHDEVAAALDVADPTMIAVDGSGSPVGTAGSASWTKIRMDLGRLDDPLDQQAVLGHETAHVYVSRLSNQAIDDDPSTGFFHEGIATWLEYELYRTVEDRERLRIHAAAIDERQQIPFHALLDEESLTSRHAREVFYPLGERFFASVVNRHGLEGVRKLLSALARDDFPRKTTGVERWRVAFQLAGYDLEAEVSAWKDALELDREAFAEELSALPRLVPTVEFADGSIRLEMSEEAPPGHQLACRFRRDASAAENTWLDFLVRDGSACSIDEASLPRPFQYQVGLRETGSDRRLWEAWETVAK